MSNLESAESWLYDKYFEFIFVILFFLPSCAVFVYDYVEPFSYVLGMIDCLCFFLLLISIKTNYLIGLSHKVIKPFKYKWLHSAFVT
jgi:hypothetical protein